MTRNTLHIFAHHQPYTLVVEPWANEFLINLDEQCRVVAFHPEVIPAFGIDMTHTRLIVWVNTGGATFEFWRGERCELSMNIPIPGAPHFS